MTAGALANIVVAPIWTVRTRMMTQSHHEDYRNSFHCAKKIYQTEGIRALYRGLVPSMLGLVCKNYIMKRLIVFSFRRFMSVFNFHCMNTLRKNLPIHHLIIVSQPDKLCWHQLFRN